MPEFKEQVAGGLRKVAHELDQEAARLRAEAKAAREAAWELHPRGRRPGSKNGRK